MIEGLPADKHFAVGDAVLVGPNKVRGIVASTVLFTQWWRGKQQFLYDIKLQLSEEKSPPFITRVMSHLIEAAPSTELAREHRISADPDVVSRGTRYRTDDKDKA